MLVDVLIPCIIDQFYPQTGFNFIKVLQKAGCSVNYNIEQTCCGKVAYDSGYWDDCKEIGSKLIKEFVFDRYIVSPSIACSRMVKQSYSDLFFNTVLHNEYKQVQRNIWELSDFLVNILKVTDLEASFSGNAFILQSCEGDGVCNTQSAMKILLQKVKGLTLVSLNGQNKGGCCGFSGIFSVKNEPLSVKMAEELLNNALEAGADTIVVNEPGCLLQLNSYLKQNAKPINVLHLADILVGN
jgi:L-lactate dehydrogenase complex protein LldE